MKPSIPQRIRVDLLKLDPALTALTNGADRAAKVNVQVLLRDASEATIARLREVGLEITRQPGRDLLVAGRIETGRLMELTATDAVRYVVKRQ
jgi:hypothetical protein